MLYSKRKSKGVLDKVDDENKKKQLIINCTKTEYIIASKRDSLKCEICIGNVKIKSMLRFNYLVCVITDDGKYGRNSKAQGIRYFSETRHGIKGLKILEAKKRVLNFHVTFICLYSKSGKFGHKWKKRL